ncbi:hypothetical protein SLNWT_1669 [Streptomyces albus]|uniref:Uncharacterized protein n=1 Tax=Streptomyces albus (strain ATCC 21838 / DSM 41398 / FERM P-419 / JCM 4703 / NBRC 107858) TaxID=1081613 RepID=A0A0B5ERX6_STRA4|nr:hypothetical protein SLNWT_1669 [Streptomyces albus]AOU76362.1 hypothetical protein SLNHY_1671 [Streptomyces albus]AYN32146.1 hypothetical protein DUI70_1644 [Streptomyces albus]
MRRRRCRRCRQCRRVHARFAGGGGAARVGRFRWEPRAAAGECVILGRRSAL